MAKFRFEITSAEDQKRYVDIQGERDFDIAFAMLSQVGAGETYSYKPYERTPTAPIEGDDIYLVVDGGKPQKFDTLEEAIIAKDKISPEKGFEILSEHPDTNKPGKENRPTVVIDHRPSFKNNETPI